MECVLVSFLLRLLLLVQISFRFICSYSLLSPSCVRTCVRGCLRRLRMRACVRACLCARLRLRAPPLRNCRFVPLYPAAQPAQLPGPEGLGHDAQKRSQEQGNLACLPACLPVCVPAHSQLLLFLRGRACALYDVSLPGSLCCCLFFSPLFSAPPPIPDARSPRCLLTRW